MQINRVVYINLKDLTQNLYDSQCMVHVSPWFVSIQYSSAFHLKSDFYQICWTSKKLTHGSSSHTSRNGLPLLTSASVYKEINESIEIHTKEGSVH